MHAYNRQKAQANQQIVSKNVFSTLEQSQRSSELSQPTTQEESQTPMKAQAQQNSSWADDYDDEDSAPLSAQQWAKQTLPARNEDEEESAKDVRKKLLEEQINQAIGADMLESASEDEKEQQTTDSQRVTRPQQSQNDKQISKQAYEKQLSKKELKQKELNDLNKVLSELGINQNQGADGESKTEKKKKKKQQKNQQDQQQQEQNNQQEQQKNGKTTDSQQQSIEQQDNQSKQEDEVADKEVADASEGGTLDPNEVKARLLAQKKKNQGSKKSTAYQVAAEEAKKRAQKGKSSKDKDNKSYNQAPIR